MSRYGMPVYRKPRSQVWAVGEWVKVGFLTLRIMGGNARQGWNLTNRDGTRRYHFVPHEGLLSVKEFS